MREETGDLWSWDDGSVVARASIRVEAFTRFGRSIEAKIVEYDERWGNHLHTFRPNPDADRPWWLIVLPDFPKTVELAIAELLHWTLGMLERGSVVLPELHPEDAVRGILDQAVLFDGERDARSIGDRFVTVRS